MQPEARTVLEEIGLTANEAKIYLALLELGPAKASEVATRAETDRSVAYTVLERLIRKGLAASVIKADTRYFSPTPPQRILDFIYAKEERAKQIIPVLEKVRPKAETGEVVEVLQGREGLKAFLEDVLREGGVMRTIGYTGRGTDILGEYYKIFEKRRVRARVKRMIVTSESRRAMVEQQKLELFEARFLPGEFLATPTSTAVYGNKVVIVFPFKHEPVMISITSEEVSKTYLNYFKFLWKLARK